MSAVAEDSFVKPACYLQLLGLPKMTEQRTLEDVGVKRTRQEEDTKPTSDSAAATESASQPQPKKAHTESGDPKQNKDSVKSQAKENQGSKSYAAPQQKSDTQDKATPEPKKPQSDTKSAEPESKKGDTEPAKPAAEATPGETNAKAPLSTSVAKPEGANITFITAYVLQHNTQYSSCPCTFLPTYRLDIFGQDKHKNTHKPSLLVTVCQLTRTVCPSVVAWLQDWSRRVECISSTAHE